MQLLKHEMAVVMTVEELGVWMQALKIAALQRADAVSIHFNDYYQQHAQLVRMFGYGMQDNEDLKARLERADVVEDEVRQKEEPGFEQLAKGKQPWAKKLDAKLAAMREEHGLAAKTAGTFVHSCADGSCGVCEYCLGKKGSK